MTYVEEIAVGTTETTGGRTITETDIVVHAGHSGDYYPHHTDAEFCRTQPFGQRIAHGTLILSVAFGLTAGVIDPHAMTYGYDRVRFVRPVFIGDTIHVVAEVREIRPYAKDPERYGVVVKGMTVLNQRDEVVVALEKLFLTDRRPAAPA